LNRAIHRTPTQPLRDSAVVLALLLLLLTVRLGPENPIGDLLPETEAAQVVPQAAGDHADAVMTLDNGPARARLLAAPAPAQWVARTLPRILIDDGATPRKTLCRITRVGDDVEASCIRVDDASSRLDTVRVELAAPCPLTPREQG